MAGISSCYPPSIPLKQGKAENNETYKISYLFEHDGVKVYRFTDRETMYTLRQKAM